MAGTGGPDPDVGHLRPGGVAGDVGQRADALGDERPRFVVETNDHVGEVGGVRGTIKAAS